MTVDVGAKLVGQPLKRKEDAKLVTGSATWTDNIQLPGMLYMAVLRSPMAHARIDRLDATPALTRPGVVAVFTASPRTTAMALAPADPIGITSAPSASATATASAAGRVRLTSMRNLPLW